MDIEDLKGIVRKYDQVRVLVIGDLMLDTFIRGNITRISDEAPVPVLDVTSEIIRPGAAANAMSNIIALGGGVVAAGVMGDDPAGRRLHRLLADNRIDTGGIVVSARRRTVEKIRILSEKFQQNILRVDKSNAGGIDNGDSARLLAFIRMNIDSVDAILVSDYNDGIVTKDLLSEVITLARERGRTVVVDSKRTDFLDYRNVDVVKVNLPVAGTITGIGQINETSIRNMGQWMLTQLEAEHVLITQGKEGMTLFARNGSVGYIPSVSREQGEASGVADTVGAVLALSLGADRSKIVEAAVLASTAAGIKVGKIGAATVTRDEMIAKLDTLDGGSLVHRINR